MQKTALLHHSPLKTPALKQVLLYPVEFLVAGASRGVRVRDAPLWIYKTNLTYINTVVFYL